MKKSNVIITKKIIFIILVIAISLPVVQHITGFSNEKTLIGYFPEIKKADFSTKNWFDGQYQEQEQKYLNKHFGFRSFFVRAYNQSQFTLYNKINAGTYVNGKNNYMFEMSYINSHLGRDFIGKDSIIQKINKISKVNDTLKSAGIDLIVLIAPGKASYHNEYIANKYEPNRKSITNYEVFKDKLDNSNIHFLDFNKWFLEMKETTEYPLFPKNGIHWSKYGEVIVSDSIVKYISKIKNTHLPKIKIENIERSFNMRGSDEDIEDILNLFYGVEDIEMGYPNISIMDKDSKSLKVLTIGDSYYTGIYEFLFSNNLFEEHQFWFYNHTIHSKDSRIKPLKAVKDINFKKEVLRNDVVLLITTEANLYRFPFGFIDQLYNTYYSKNNI